jgi:prepilin-type processing-associated H-X9-DG protein
MYIESNQAGEPGYDRTNIIPITQDQVNPGDGYIEFRHYPSTVIVFADGHVYSMTQPQVIVTLGTASK